MAIAEAPTAQEKAVATEPEVLREMDGRYGKITIIKSQREVTDADEDIHTLLARIILKKERRLAAARS